MPAIARMARSYRINSAACRANNAPALSAVRVPADNLFQVMHPALSKLGQRRAPPRSGPE
jgi:hypothetical protein